MTVRLAQAIGMETIVDYARRFGVVEAMPATLSMALGAGETTVLKLTAAYGQFVNGGKRITPTLIDRIQDRTGRTVFRHDNRPCAGCRAEAWVGQIEPPLPDSRAPTVDPGTAYQIVAMLQGVVERGTGVRIRELDRPLAGKTGTTNDSFDGWFVGFSPDLVVGVYVGFDTPRTLGARETGSSVAVPIFKDFMQAALAGKPSIPFRVPPDIRLVRVDPETGLPTQPGDRKAILEAFKPGSEPTADRIVLEGGEGLAPKGEAGPSVGVGVGVSVGVGVGAQPTAGTGGLY
jgi:penicillin-binding protein 1A